jgi:Flp pilus assembly pilin Flp
VAVAVGDRSALLIIQRWIDAIPPEFANSRAFAIQWIVYEPARSLHLHVRMTSSRLLKLVRDQRGATMVDYAILLFLVLVVAAAVYRNVGKKVRQAGDMTAQQFN